ncbi:UNC93-like protein MFSD11 [Caenorhabditis elegans]|uniref:UNC93-like protein MFSD11 n=1 Tax=Caenorhabditis elegans TaxID=6239 RepID=I7LFE4_CAEEL|nr:UNC93-like protein MFSD11 [Caenorhabditis elegans]CCJ09400.1 UNC93-like protein MFSD11 [Caenorhabditis elegans]|eukprot:NP_001263659.1 Uncharacterized protein CELE_Y52E8A.6 [Caenorhabditis elegans]
MAIDQGTKNVLRLSISFLLLFFAYMSQEYIQEPLIEEKHKTGGNIDPHAGYHSFAITYFFFTLSCLFVAPIIDKISAKWGMVLRFSAYIAFQYGFIHMNTYYVYITSASLGVGGAFIWVGQGKYLTENCTSETIERNIALTWFIFKFCLLGGGIFLYVLFYNQKMNEFLESGDYKTFVYICCSISLLAAINTAFLPQSVYVPERKKHETFAKTLKATFKIMRESPMLLLVSIFLYTGFSRSFWIAIYPTCIKFTPALGDNTAKLLAMSGIATGIGQIVAGGIFSVLGKRVRILGKDMIVVIACVLHLICFVLIYLFFPYDAPLHPTQNVGTFEPNAYIAIFCSGLLGFGDAIIQTQVYSFLCDGYSEESSHAFALFKFYSAISSTIAFFVSKYFTLAGHLVLYGVFAILSAITTVLAQRLYFHKTRHLNLNLSLFN